MLPSSSDLSLLQVGFYEVVLGRFFLRKTHAREWAKHCINRLDSIKVVIFTKDHCAPLMDSPVQIYTSPISVHEPSYAASTENPYPLPESKKCKLTEKRLHLQLTHILKRSRGGKCRFHSSPAFQRISHFQPNSRLQPQRLVCIWQFCYSTRMVATSKKLHPEDINWHYILWVLVIATSP